MEKKREICKYREKLDKTLASPELTNDQTLRTLISNQLNEECNVDILDKKVNDLSNILQKLRSVPKDQDLIKSSNEGSFGDWKVKHDREDCRVMYRERLEGSPFYTIFMEGYMEGTIEECLCVSWESSLYEKWWPKSTFPAFRILQTKCLQKLRIDEQICLVRMKVPWPITDREAIVQFFLFEYFKDGLLIILINSISSEVESGLSESVNAVRIDLVGGFAIQKVSPERIYLRFISELDIKLDVVPPSLINMASSRIGNTFRVYKKTIGSVAKSADYSRLLVDPLYTHIRKAMFSNEKTDEICNAKEPQSKEGRYNEPLETRHCENEHVPCKRDVHETEEEERKSIPSSLSYSEDENVSEKTQNNNVITLFCIRHKVKQILETLARVISTGKKTRKSNHTSSSSGVEEEASSPSQKQHPESTTIVSNSNVCIQDPNIEVLDEASLTHYHNNINSASSSFVKESNKIAHASAKIDLATKSHNVTVITISEATSLSSQTVENNDDKPSGLNGGNSSILQRKQNKGCFGCMSWMRRT